MTMPGPDPKGGPSTMPSRRWLVLCSILLGAAAFSAAIEQHRAQAQSNAPSIEQLLETLSEAADPKARRRAAERLGTLGVEPAHVIAVLVQVLGWDEDAAVRGRAAEALGLIGPATEDAASALIEALELDDQLRVRWRAIEALERIGPHMEGVVPALIDALQNDPLRGVRARAAQALGTIDPETEHVVPALIRAFQGDEQPGVRWQAATALEKTATRLANAKATASIVSLKEALAALEVSQQPEIQSNAEAVRKAIQRLEAEPGTLIAE